MPLAKLLPRGGSPHPVSPRGRWQRIRAWASWHPVCRTPPRRARRAMLREGRAMRHLSDGELMGRYSDGSQGAFEELFRRYEARAFGFFLRRVHGEARARDLYQELFLRLHRFRHAYDASRPFEPWFFHIARRVLVDEWRRQFREARVDLDVAELRSSEPD